MNEAMVREWVERCGIDVAEEKGGELWAPCPDPDHDDHNPSWSINVESGRHYCFSCHFGGGLRTLVQVVLGEGEAQGLRLDDKAPPVHSVNKRLDPSLRPIRRHRPAEHSVISEAELVLYEDPPPWALEQRRLDRGAVDLFGIRWSGKDDAWVLPLRRPEGLIGYQIKAQGRSYVRNRPVGMDKSSTLFGLREATDPSSVVLVESPLDAALLSMVDHQAVALCGSRMSNQQRDLLQHYDLVLLALDNDDAGRVETERILRSMPGFECRAMDYGGTDAKDVGEMEVEDIDRRLRALVV